MSESSLRSVSGLLTTVEAADYLRLSPRTLEDMRVTGNGPRGILSLGLASGLKSFISATIWTVGSLVSNSNQRPNIGVDLARIGDTLYSFRQ